LRLTPVLYDNLGAAPHPACGHLLPGAEKDLSPLLRNAEREKTGRLTDAGVSAKIDGSDG